MNSLDYQRIFHEIKNTITLINSSIQLLDRKCPQFQEEPYWQNTRQEVSYLKNMILEISQNGDMEQLQKKPLNINSLICSSCQYINDSFPNLKWNLILDESLPDICVDSTKLKQSILNLLKNSAEAMEGSGCITVMTRQETPMLCIEITDCGGGVPVEMEDKIYDMFTTSKERGTGLGLTITRQMIENHGGSLQLKNKPGKGCTFSILLPLNA